MFGFSPTISADRNYWIVLFDAGMVATAVHGVHGSIFVQLLVVARQSFHTNLIIFLCSAISARTAKLGYRNMLAMSRYFFFSDLSLSKLHDTTRQGWLTWPVS